MKQNWLRSWCDCVRPANKADIKIIIMKLSELQGKLDALNTQLDKSTAEIVAEVQTLKDSLGGVELPADAQASLDRLATKVQALDDLNPDAPAALAPPA